MAIESMAYEYYVQPSPRVNAAAPVADFGTKSVSTLTVRPSPTAPASSRTCPTTCRFGFGGISRPSSLGSTTRCTAACSTPSSSRRSGDGTGENMVGILNTPGTTAVPFNTDVPTTLRSAQTALQTLGEEPTGWAFNPPTRRDRPAAVGQ